MDLKCFKAKKFGLSVFTFLKDGASYYGNILALFMTMQEKQILLWPTGIQKEN